MDAGAKAAAEAMREAARVNFIVLILVDLKEKKKVRTVDGWNGILGRINCLTFSDRCVLVLVNNRHAVLRHNVVSQ